MSKLLLDLYKKIFLIREAEEEIRREYSKDGMKTPMHMSLGEEAIVAGVCQALPQNSHSYGTYRSHALYLAWTGETDKFFAELYGKIDGLAGGRAGSMHLASPEHGLIMTSAIVATTIPPALGDAFEAKYNNKDRITVVFFGDGATDEGAFWESLNAACLWQLPILFVCEDNNLAIHTPKSQRRGYDSLVEIIKKFQCSVFDGSGIDAEDVYLLANSAIDSIKKYKKPSFLNLRYYRYLEHVGVNEDFNSGYRQAPEPKDRLLRDPVYQLRQKLIADNYLNAIEEIEKQIHEQVHGSRIKAQEADFPKKEDLTKGVFHGEQ